MALLDFESLISPVADDSPCGVDLELEGDMEYMNFLAGAEGTLPKSFFGRDAAGNEDRPFDRSSIDFAAQFKAAEPFLEKTRDLRLLGILAKFSILNRDLAGFISCVKAISTLITNHWEDVHPRGEDGDFGLRMVAIEALDSSPTVIMPLQFMPLIEHKRLGSFSYRAYTVARGDAPPLSDEEGGDLATLERLLQDAELDLIVERRNQLMELDEAIKQIRLTWQENCSGPPASLERLPVSVSQIIALFDGVVAQRDPSAAAGVAEAGTDGEAPATQQTGATAAPGRVATGYQAAAALTAVAGYFNSLEPSNPALLLVRQAHALLGKSFLDVLRILLPNHVDRAAFNIGRDQVFNLPIERLAEFAYSDGVQPDGTGAEETTYEVRTRAEALALLDQVGSYLRVSEPSSPIPFLIDRARDVAQRDFLTVLKALLPADELKPPEPT